MAKITEVNKRRKIIMSYVLVVAYRVKMMVTRL